MTTPLRFRVPDSVSVRLADVSAKLTAAHAKPIDHQDVARIALEIGLRALESCPNCSERRRCDLHLPGTGPQRALHGIAAPEAPAVPADPQKDFTRIRDCYFEEYERARGGKPVFRGAEGSAIKRLVRDIGSDSACAAIRGTYADPFGLKYSTILTIAKDPGRYMNAPKSSTVQRSGSEGKAWRKAQEVST